MVCAQAAAATIIYKIVACAETCDRFHPADIARLAEGQAGVYRGLIGVIPSPGAPEQGQRLSFRAQSRNPLNQHRRRRYRSFAPDTLTFALPGRTRLIPVKGGPFAIVDAADYEAISKYQWYARHTPTTCYAMARHKGKFIQMHRLITDVPRRLVVDHIDRNGLNNTRKNLRLCRQAENARNQGPRPGGTTKYKGVSWHAHRRKFRARITYEGKEHSLGYFTDEKEAARAYDKKANELFGRFAYLNFPEELRGQAISNPDGSGRPKNNECRRAQRPDAGGAPSALLSAAKSRFIGTKSADSLKTLLFPSCSFVSSWFKNPFMPFRTRGPPTNHDKLPTGEPRRAGTVAVVKL